MSAVDTLMAMSNESTGGPTARDRTPEALAFAAQLRAERAAAGMSQDDLVAATGISKSAIARIETGVRVMDTAQLGKFCRAFGITIAQFAIRADERMRADAESRPSRRHA
jgi:transcriptional regulator with XRE-family HTH domain